MRKHTQIRIASAAMATLLAATQIAMPFPAIAADEDYVYCAAALSWAEYWEQEGVFLSDDANGDWTAESADSDTRGESDLGAYDTVTRATSNHGLHRGSYQCVVKVYDTDGNAYDYTGKGNGESVDVVKGDNGTMITVDGKEVGTYDHSMILGPKYVPVAVPASLYDDFKQKYSVLENGDSMVGGYTEKNLVAINETVDVSADTDGLKTVSQNEDGTYTFSKRAETNVGKTVDESAIEISDVKYKSGYGDFLRVDIGGDYGDLGAHMYAVRWDYYGDQDTVLASYGTKFAADNWMHKAMGIQLGLTDSLRCTLPEGTDGTGYWTITLTALGYNDVTYKFQATEENIVKASEDKTITTTELEAAIAKAEALKEADYTAESWASMQMELQEAKDELKNPKTQATVDEAVSHLNAAIEALVKAEGDKTEEDKKDDDKKEEPAAVDTSSLEKVISDAAALKEADYTVDSWKALQSALTDAKSALNEKESQEKVDKATDALNTAIKALVKNGNQAGSQNGSATPTVTKKAGTTTDGSASKGTSGSKAAKTGDPANVLGLLGLAFSSLGAGVGGFAWKRKRK